MATPPGSYGLGGDFFATKGNDVTRQHLKQADKFTIGIAFAFSIVDAGLAIKYLTTIPKAEKPGLAIANEVVSWLPNLLSPLRLTGPKGAIALSVVWGCRDRQLCHGPQIAHRRSGRVVKAMSVA